MEINSDLISQLEALTKKGDSQQVINIIDKLVLKRTPRKLAAALAQICFRNSLYLEALRVLNPIVNPQLSGGLEPEPAEIVAYASSLVSLSMYREARQYLKRIDKDKYPEALLIESFSYFGEWDYQKTIPLLKKYSANAGVSYYRQIVGKVNLAAAYVTTTQVPEAEKLLQWLLVETQERDYKLLHGNTLELFAQLEIQNKNYGMALEYLTKAKKIFPENKSIYYFFIRKWESICLMLLSPTSKDLVEKCKAFKEEALLWRHWETARDIDLYISYATNNTELLQKIIFGTPNPHFIKKVENLFLGKIKPAKEFALSANITESVEERNILKYSEIVSSLENNQYQRKLFTVLTQDFYKPANLGYIFSQLYPNEFFNPDTSEKRVINQVYALKNALNNLFNNSDNRQRPHFIIRKSKMDFIFQPLNEVILLFTSRGHRIHYKPTLKEKLKALGSAPFSSAQFADRLACSKRKAQMLIKTLLRQNFLLQFNAGPKTVYVLKRK